MASTSKFWYWNFLFSFLFSSLLFSSFLSFFSLSPSLPQFKATEIYCHIVKATNTKSRCLYDHALSEGSREEFVPYLFLLASSVAGNF
jgi:hypothetical protein